MEIVNAHSAVIDEIRKLLDLDDVPLKGFTLRVNYADSQPVELLVDGYLSDRGYEKWKKTGGNN